MKTAMIFAAGKGTRLKPITDSKPKALVEVAGKPLLWHVIQKLKREGIEHIVINIHHFASQIVSYVRENDSFGLDIQFSDESDKLRETGGGILYARPLLKEDFLIYNTDIFSNLDIQKLGSFAESKSLLEKVSESDVKMHSQDLLQSQKAVSTIVVSERKTQRYFIFDENMRLCGWKNIATGQMKSSNPLLYKVSASCQPSFVKPKYKLLAFAGIHFVSQDLFEAFDDVKKSPENYPLYDEKGEKLKSSVEPLSDAFSITDFYLRIAEKYPIYGYVPEDFKLLDVGKHASLKEAEALLNDK